MSDEPLEQAYVRHGDRWFMVSTINRDSSSPLGGRYAETLVWEWNWGKKERGDLIGQDESSENSRRAHDSMVKRLRETGSPEYQDVS